MLMAYEDYQKLLRISLLAGSFQMFEIAGLTLPGQSLMVKAVCWSARERVVDSLWHHTSKSSALWRTELSPRCCHTLCRMRFISTTSFDTGSAKPLKTFWWKQSSASPGGLRRYSRRSSALWMMQASNRHQEVSAFWVLRLCARFSGSSAQQRLMLRRKLPLQDMCQVCSYETEESFSLSSSYLAPHVLAGWRLKSNSAGRHRIIEDCK